MNFKVVILSARAANLIPCVQSVLAHEPDLPPDCIIVVDDGARSEAEACLPGIQWVSGVKPFIFARNANLGIRAAGTDIILLNDDAQLTTRCGFSHLAELIQATPAIGICSASIQGVVGNANQQLAVGKGLRYEEQTLAFVCVYIPQSVYQQVGPLDERFHGYGFEDNDYCRRVRATGLRLAIADSCVVDHSGRLPSTFRTRSNLNTLFELNRHLFQEKCRGQPMLEDRSVDLLYLACNRLEFTRETFTTLVANTDWRYVRTLFVIDDGSRDGTREWLESHLSTVPSPTQFLKTRFGSPVTAMVHFIRLATAPLLAKLDNDAMVPPGWLRQSLEVMYRHPELALLGIEAMYPHADDPHLTRSYTPAEFISGLGLYRRTAFGRSLPRAYDKWFGLEEWQVAQGPRLTRGWITPALPVFLLDRIPFEPWAGYTENYVRQGIQRAWPKYAPSSTLWDWRWPRSTVLPPARSDARLRFLGALRVKNEAMYIADVMTRMLQVCDQIFVFDDNSTDDTVSICQSFGSTVVVFPSPFSGFNEARDKNYLLEKLIVVKPEWVLWIDGDEILEKSGPEKLRQAADLAVGVAAYSLRVAYVWDDPQRIRVDGIFGRFRRPSMFQLRGQPLDRLHFPQTGAGGNLHCGNVPQGLVGAVRDLNVRLRHIGYMTREQRLEKYRWYTQIDPNNVNEDNYRHLAEIPGARYAPGPPRFERWLE